MNYVYIFFFFIYMYYGMLSVRFVGVGHRGGGCGGVGSVDAKARCGYARALCGFITQGCPVFDRGFNHKHVATT